MSDQDPRGWIPAGGLFPLFVICVAVMPRRLRHGRSGSGFHSIGEGGEHTLLRKLRKEKKRKEKLTNGAAGLLTDLSQNKLIYMGLLAASRKTGSEHFAFLDIFG